MDNSAVAAESAQAAMLSDEVALIAEDNRDRSIQSASGYVATGLAFDLAEGDQFVVDGSGQSATLSNAEGQILLSLEAPSLTRGGGTETLPAKFSVLDNVLQVVPLDATAGQTSLNQHASCFESWLAGFIVGVSGELLVCLPIGLAFAPAGVACAVGLAGFAAVLNFSRSCG
ncbi:hypothetical protein [Cryobacterium lyxosi]|uniref:Uncharacterized protein n=1 Tax=Cryobacterium lyxosi TaxID=1259228 RepID=A0A4R8ZES2_9MICO|nr:hypothetical protein [Cryobacterium lyxosi]TFD25098.1 hypothetical protein E3T27_09950 [Cryobacterium lyxosi]